MRIAAYLVDPDWKNAHDDHADSSSKAEKRLEKLVAELSSSSDVAQVAGVLARCSRTMATSGALPGLHLALCSVYGFSGALLHAASAAHELQQIRTTLRFRPLRCRKRDPDVQLCTAQPGSGQCAAGEAQGEDMFCSGSVTHLLQRTLYVLP